MHELEKVPPFKCTCSNFQEISTRKQQCAWPTGRCVAIYTNFRQDMSGNIGNLGFECRQHHDTIPLCGHPGSTVKMDQTSPGLFWPNQKVYILQEVIKVGRNHRFRNMYLTKPHTATTCHHLALQLTPDGRKTWDKNYPLTKASACSPKPQGLGSNQLGNFAPAKAEEIGKVKKQSTLRSWKQDKF